MSGSSTDSGPASGLGSASSLGSLTGPGSTSYLDSMPGSGSLTGPSSVSGFSSLSDPSSVSGSVSSFGFLSGLFSLIGHGLGFMTDLALHMEPDTCLAQLPALDLCLPLLCIWP